MHRTVILGLPAILIAYLLVVYQHASVAWFGYYHDDSLYWTAAKSLAEGDGYRMPSMPGEPRQTKYPVLFPWLLSWVWRIEPGFPANLGLASGLVALSGAAFLGGVFVLLGQLGFGAAAALALTAICAFHPVFVHLSGLLLSDVPFMALVVWSLVLAQRALDGRGQVATWSWVAALGLAAAAVLMRSIGVALLAGIAVTAAWRNSYRPALACVAVAAGAALAAVFLAPAPLAAAVSAAGALDGYQQTLRFYGSYLAFWKLSTPDWGTFGSMLMFNIREMLKETAVLAFMAPASGFASFGWQLAAIALSFSTLRGVWGLTAGRRHVALGVLGVYAAVVLLWNYTLMDRFFLWALPLFLAGAWAEIRALGRQTAAALRRPAPWLERALAVVVVGSFAAAIGWGGYRYLRVVPRGLAGELAARRQSQAEKQQAYEWIRRNSSPADRFIADEDASLYLYTGRQALRPMAFSTASFYQQSQEPLDRDLARLTDTARAIGARYWLAAPDDYHLESAQESIQKRAAEDLEDQPAVFVGSGGAVRIYDITRLTAAAQ